LDEREAQDSDINASTEPIAEICFFMLVIALDNVDRSYLLHKSVFVPTTNGVFTVINYKYGATTDRFEKKEKLFLCFYLLLAYYMSKLIF